MRNLLNREEYLIQMNEGIKDVFIRGVNKIKRIFKLGMYKVKNFIVSFDRNGKILPVITSHALIDHFSNVDGANVIASNDLNIEVKSAGGTVSNNKIPYEDDGEIDSYCPKFSSRKEMVDWFKNKEYEKENSYKNFLSLSSESLNEDLVGKFKDRINYSKDDELEGIKTISTEKFKKDLVKRIFAYSTNSKFKQGNILFLGAPGIGKSTIPRIICEEFDKGKDEKDRVCLITVDSQTIQPGDLMMPKIPSDKTVLEDIEKNDPEEFKRLSGSNLADKLKNISQDKSEFLPPSWLPVYKKTNDNEVNKYLDERANGGIIDIDGTTVKTGGGGILLFDELLRADPMIFHQLMNLFSPSRTINGYTLGSKWVIVACTNRPADSELVADVWKQMNANDGALAQRFPYKYVIEPDPEGWKKWAETNLQADDMILDFIFEDESATGEGEYPRWHSISKSNADEKFNQSVSPRQWEEAIKAINNELEMNNYTSISEMDNGEIVDCLDGLFDDDFINEFATWIENHSANVTIDQIIENTNIRPRRNKNTEDFVIVKDIWSQVEKAHENGREFNDDEMSNLMLWFGKNFKSMNNLVETEFLQFLDKLVPVDEVLETYHNALRIYNAAYPTKEVLQMINEDDEFAEYIDIEILKDLIEKYFPWNIKDGKIIPIDNHNV